MKPLTKLALHREGERNHDRGKDLFGQRGDERKAIMFHQSLLNYIKEWANVHTFIDGKVSTFMNVLDFLNKHKVTFPPAGGYNPPPNEAPRSNPRAVESQSMERNRRPAGNSGSEKLCAEGYELVLSVGQIMEVWMEDKDLIPALKEQMNGMQKKVQTQINNSPEGDLDNLFALNDCFNQLPELMDSAAKGNKHAQQSIIKLVNDVEKRSRGNSNEEVKSSSRREPAVPKVPQREVKKEIKKEIKREVRKEVKEEVKKIAPPSDDEFEFVEDNKIITSPKELDYVNVQAPYKTSMSQPTKVEARIIKNNEPTNTQPIPAVKSPKKATNPFKSPVRATQPMTNEFFTNIQPKQNEFPRQNAFAANAELPSEDAFQFDDDNPGRKVISEEYSGSDNSKASPHIFSDSNHSRGRPQIKNNYLYPDNDSDKVTPEKAISERQQPMLTKNSARKSSQRRTPSEKHTQEKLPSDRKQNTKREKEQEMERMKEQEAKRKNMEKGNELKRKINELTKGNNDMKRKSDRILKSKEELQDKYSKLRKMIIERRTEARDEINKMKLELAKLNRDIANSNTKGTKSIEIENDKIALENSQLESKIKVVKENVENLKRQNERLAINKNTIVTSIENLKKILVEEEMKKKALEEELKAKELAIDYSKPKPIVQQGKQPMAYGIPREVAQPETLPISEPYYTTPSVSNVAPTSYELPAAPIEMPPAAAPFYTTTEEPPKPVNTAIFAHVLDEMSVADTDPNSQNPQLNNPMVNPIADPSGYYTAVPSSQPMVDPIEHAKSQIEGKYRGALTAPRAVLYEDHILQLGMMKNVNKASKTVNLKLFFGNKMSDCGLRILKCLLGIYDSKSLSITLRNPPTEIAPKGQAVCDMIIQVGKFFSIYNYFTIQYESGNGVQNLITLKVPVNILMLCEASNVDLHSIQATVGELSNSKVSGSFQLDTNRMKSMSQVRKALSEGNTMFIIDQSPGTIFAVTEFPNTANKLIQAIAHINISKNVKECGLVVYGANSGFRDTITKNILDILSAPKQ